MAPLFSTANITRFTNEAEDQFNQLFNCILDRYSIPVVSGTGVYDLPATVLNISRVTYKGWKLDPLPQRDLRAQFLSGSQSGRPYWYVFNNIGQLKIQLFPVPQEDVDAVVTGLWGSAILSSVIVEHYRASDYTTYIIPSYIRRRLLKAYVLKRCFEVDSKGGNLKAAKYWTAKWDNLVEMYGEMLDDLITKPRNLVANQDDSPFGFRPPSPINPVRYLGYDVDY